MIMFSSAALTNFVVFVVYYLDIQCTVLTVAASNFTSFSLDIRGAAPPLIDGHFFPESVVAEKGSRVRLLCSISKGDPPIRIQWFKNGKPLSSADPGSSSSSLSSSPSSSSSLSSSLSSSSSSQQGRHYVIQTQEDFSSTIAFSNVQQSDGSQYTCIASNLAGSTNRSLQLTVLEPPSPPVNITILNVSSRSVTLRWLPGFNGNSAIKWYRLVYKGQSGVSHHETGQGGPRGETKEEIVEGDKNHAHIQNLLPVTMYKLTLSAQNDIGTSDDSQAITVTTLEEAPEGPPVEVRVQSTGSQSLKVSWLPPRRDLRHGTVLGYYIGYKVSSSDDQFQYKHFIPETPPSASSSSSPSSSFVNDTVQTSYLTNLKQLTRYQISVQAYNKGGVGPMSQYVEASTIVTTPPKSPTVTTLSSTNSSIAVLIDVEDKEKLITSEYVLHYKEDTKKEWKEIRLSPHIQEYHLMDLLCGTRYQLYMTASNTVGRSEPGPTVSVRTKGAAPVSPSMASAFVDISTSEVTINLGSWSDGGCPIHYFNIQNKQRNAKNWTPIHEKLVLQNSSHKGSSRHLTLTNFLPDREYIVQINARNDAGVTQAEYDIRIPSDILFSATPSHPYVMSASGHRGQSPMTRTKYDGDHNGDLRPPPLTFSSSQLTTRSPPSFNDNDYMTMNDLPLYKNLALILPIMASLAVITLLMATVFWCFRRSPLIESNYGFPEQGKPSNTVSLCELSSGNSTSRLNISSSVKASASSQANNTASESIMAANNQHHLRSDSVHSQLSSFDGQTNGQQATSCILLSPQKQTIHFKIHEYAEPYTMSAVDGRTCQMTKEQFATIKRANPRARPSIYAPGPAQQGNGSFIEQPQQQLFICQRH